MIKKALLLLTIPYLLFIYLESCNKSCEHKETVNIVGIECKTQVLDINKRNRIHIILQYERYFVDNFQVNLTNKAMAMTKSVYNNCFYKLLNPIDSISIRSKQNFSTALPANSELNSQFIVSNYPAYRVQDYRTRIENNKYEPQYFEDNFTIQNDTIPTSDSIHDLIIEVFCTNGEIFQDSLIGINLKSSL